MAAKVLVAFLAWLIACAGASARSPDSPSKPVRSPVRSSTAWGTNLIAEGCRRSAILGEIVGLLRTRRIVVYVQPSNHLPQHTDGYLCFVGESGGYRYLRVILKPRLPRHELIALLAHELQHVREVSEAAEVVDQDTFTALFERIGHPSLAGFDTPAARLVGLRVSHELQAR